MEIVFNPYVNKATKYSPLKDILLFIAFYMHLKIE